MPSDRSRGPDDPSQPYTAVVMQQGRVILDRDFNALQEVVNERAAADGLAVIGPSGTPDDGFRIGLPSGPAASAPGSGPPHHLPDFTIKPGAMYVGGQRVAFPPDPAGWRYFRQPDGRDPADADVGSAPAPAQESVYLHLVEQEVGGVEDPDLLDVALGGPDTTQRVRLLRRVRRQAVTGTTCKTAFGSLAAAWQKAGYQYHDGTARLLPQVRLKVTFDPSPAASDPCDPVVRGGYVGAENQLIRVQITDPEPQLGGRPRLLWGYDNASFLYRIDLPTASDGRTVRLVQAPPDDFHQPRPGQVVEVLRTAVVLAPARTAVPGRPSVARCVAEPTGVVGEVTAFDPGSNTLTLVDPLPAAVRDDSNPLFLRVWQGREAIDLAPAGPTPLTDPTGRTPSGVRVEISRPAGTGPNAAIPVGAFWVFAVRPDTPQAVYPDRFLTDPQPPDGPRQWACPLAVINWAGASFSGPPASTPDAIIDDCRRKFLDLVTLTSRETAGEVFVNGVFATSGYGQSVVVRNGDTIGGADLARGLRVLLNQPIDPRGATTAACVVTLDMLFVVGGRVVGLEPINLAAAVGADDPTVVTWDPDPDTRLFLTNQLPQNGKEAFVRDWDVVLGGAGTWRYAAGDVESGTPSGSSPTPGRIALHRQAVRPGARAVALAASTYADSRVGLVFNYISSNNYWVFSYKLSFFAGGGFSGHTESVDVTHYVNGNPAESIPVTVPHTLTPASRVEFRVTLLPGQPTTFTAHLKGLSVAVPIGAVAPAPAAGSRVGLLSTFGSNTFTRLVVDYNARESQHLVPLRHLARLTLKRDFLRPAGAGAAPAAPEPPRPDFSAWFWVTPTGTGYGQGIPGIGTILV